MRKREQIKLFLSFILIIVVIVAIIFTTKYFLNTSTIQTIKTEKSNLLPILIVGLDDEKVTNGRTDSIFLALYNDVTKKLFLYTIPRDLRLYVKYDSGAKYDKINHIYKRSDIVTLKNTLQRLLKIDIPYYAVINYDAFSSVVDVLGGVKINVEKDMYYVDHSGELYINLQKGIQILDGEKALEYIRYRSDKDGDLGRIQRQINFVNALMRKKTEFMKISKINEILNIFMSKIETNFTIMDIKYLIDEFEQFTFDSFYYDMMRTRNVKIDGIDYLLPLKSGLYSRLRVDEIISFIANESQNWKKTIRVQIKNGSIKTGMARKLRNKLINYNVDVVYYGNADRIYKESVIYDRVGELKYAQSIGEIIETNNIYTQKDKNLGVDVTIIIGEDFNIDKVD